LHSALNYDETCLTVTDIEWGQFASVFTAARRSPLITTIPEATLVESSADAQSSSSLQLPRYQILGSASNEHVGGTSEQVLCVLFAEVLGVPQVDVDDDFFALGGNSIMSMQLARRARKRGLLFTPSDVFKSRTAAALADSAVVAGAPTAQQVQEPLVAVSQDQIDLLENMLGESQ
jgi:aryl carrier-like protein